MCLSFRECVRRYVRACGGGGGGARGESLLECFDAKIVYANKMSPPPCLTRADGLVQ